MLDNQFHEGGFNEGMKKVDCNQSKPRPPKSAMPRSRDIRTATRWNLAVDWLVVLSVETTKMATIRASYALIGLLVGLLLQGDSVQNWRRSCCVLEVTKK